MAILLWDTIRLGKPASHRKLVGRLFDDEHVHTFARHESGKLEHSVWQS